MATVSAPRERLTTAAGSRLAAVIVLLLAEVRGNSSVRLCPPPSAGRPSRQAGDEGSCSPSAAQRAGRAARRSQRFRIERERGRTRCGGEGFASSVLQHGVVERVRPCSPCRALAGRSLASTRVSRLTSIQDTAMEQD
jgi:hypothetical protein